ncbi:uncharacterized protein LOC106152272, partial [Lingula anatina]|uniref:Uncharacterized protein LOC106152272 n=1 Tax=Lingula anatina TaxID=7574 RepID=A0A1S3H5G0_LINAN
MHQDLQIDDIGEECFHIINDIQNHGHHHHHPHHHHKYQKQIPLLDERGRDVVSVRPTSKQIDLTKNIQGRTSSSSLSGDDCLLGVTSAHKNSANLSDFDDISSMTGYSAGADRTRGAHATSQFVDRHYVPDQRRFEQLIHQNVTEDLSDFDEPEYHPRLPKQKHESKKSKNKIIGKSTSNKKTRQNKDNAAVRNTAFAIPCDGLPPMEDVHDPQYLPGGVSSCKVKRNPGENNDFHYLHYPQHQIRSKYHGGPRNHTQHEDRSETFL